jgi:hypothetical protein
MAEFRERYTRHYAELLQLDQLFIAV